MRTIVVLVGVAALVFGLGCDKKGKTLSGKDYDELKSINESIRETKAAIDLAFSGKPSFTAADESFAKKVQEKADIIKAENCRQGPARDDEPIGQYDRDWRKETEVAGATCSVKLLESGVYTHSQRKLNMYEDFQSAGEFAKETVVQSYNITGKIEAVNTSGRTTVTGRADFKNMRVRDMGLVAVKMRTSFSAMGSLAADAIGGTGSGSASLSIQSKGFKHDVRIIVAGSKTSYRINGIEVDLDMIHDLFSSYGLLEMVDRSAKMR